MGSYIRNYLSTRTISRLEWTLCPYCHWPTKHDPKVPEFCGFRCFHCSNAVGPNGGPVDYVREAVSWYEFLEDMGIENSPMDEQVHRLLVTRLDGIKKKFKNGDYEGARQLNEGFAEQLDEFRESNDVQFSDEG